MSRIKVRFNETEIDTIFRDLDQSHLPGAAVGIAIAGIPIYRKGFGLASMELPVTITPQTRMRIYSITKHFTCLAYLLFCEQGKASLDDPIGKYLPELHPVTHRVTMRQLMSNTSGLRDACDIRWSFSGIEGIVPARELLTLYRHIHDVNFSPGEAWCYNNGGFQILSAIVEKLADRPLEEVFREQLFEPVGMYDTLLRRTDRNFVPNSASMHMLNVCGSFERQYLPGELLGEGGIVSTADDMLRWVVHMASPCVGKPGTWAAMTTEQKLRGEVSTGYGLGLFCQHYRGIDMISHSGGGLGSNSQMIWVPDAELGIVVLVNREDVSAVDLAGRILQISLGTAAHFRGEPAGFTGTFCSNATGRVVEVYSKANESCILVDGTEEFEVARSEHGALRPDAFSCLNLELKSRGDPVTPSSVLYSYFGCSDELLRVTSDGTYSLDAIAGTYLDESIGIQLSIVSNGGEAQMITEGRFGSVTYGLQWLGGDLWKARRPDRAYWGAVLDARARGGKLILRTPRSWHITLRRGS